MTSPDTTTATGAGTPPGEAARVLRRVFGYDSFRPGQQEIIEHVIAGGDALVIMPTGAGSAGLHVSDGVVISGACGRLTRVALHVEGGDASERQVTRPGCVTAIERLPDGRLLLGTVLGADPFEIIGADALFEP